MFSLLVSTSNHGDELSCKERDELLQNPIRFEITLFFSLSSPFKYFISSFKRRNDIIIILLLPRCFMTRFLKLIFYNSFQLVSQVTQNFIFDLFWLCFFIQPVYVCKRFFFFFCYKRKAKKRLWDALNTWLKFAQIEGIFFQINYGIHGRQY